MVTKQDIERILERDGAPAGYRIQENEHGQITVEYPADIEVSRGSTLPVRYDALSPCEEISRCSEILELEGYDTELTPGDQHTYCSSGGAAKAAAHRQKSHQARLSSLS